MTALLPKGAEMVSTVVDGNRLVVTLRVGARWKSARSICTSKATGRLRFAPEP